MTGPGHHSAVSALVFASVISGLSVGCTGIGLCGAAHQHASARPEPVSAVEPASGERTALAVVEEFLARTQDYQAPGTVSLEPVPAPPVVRNSPGFKVPVPDRDPRQPAEVTARTVSQPDTAFANMQMTLGENPPGPPAPAVPLIESITIRAAPPSMVPVEQSAAANTANHPLEVEPGQVAITAERFLEHLKSLAEEAKDFATEWQLRLAQLALNREAEDSEVSSNLSPDAKRILAALVRLGAAARRVAGDPLLPGDEALQQLEELRRVLADRADPTVSTIALCRKVVTFGVYDELSDDDFVAGRTAPAIVYSEIRSLRSEKVADDQYRTVLATRLEVLTAMGDSVWEHEEPEIVDLCRRPRTDFFIAQRIALPPTLPTGEYVLKVLVEDKLSGKANESAHRFAIFSPTSLAANR